MDQEQQYDELFKVVLVGDAGVGKTNMLAFFTSEEQYSQGSKEAAKSFQNMRKPTIGVEFGTRIITAPDGAKIKAQIWDTAGQERYRAITSSHYRRAAGALLVYDVTSRKSFENAQNLWLKELESSADEDSGLLQCIMLVGNKIDLDAEVSEDEHNAALKQPENVAVSELMSARTSAMTGEGVEDAFKNLIIKIYMHDKEHSKVALERSGMTLEPPTGRKKGGCC